jgi:hypothetical protein
LRLLEKYDQQALAEISRRNPPPPELGFALVIGGKKSAGF